MKLISIRQLIYFTGAAVMIALTAHPLSAQITPEYPPDNSLTLDEYLKLGVPAIDRPWAASDYARALRIMDSIAGVDPSHLPRYGSLNSGALFERMVNEENPNLLRVYTGDASVRLAMLIPLMDNTGKLFMAYYQPAVGGKILDDELLELGRQVLLTSTVVIGLADSVLSIDRQKSDTIQRLKINFRQMQAGLGMTVNGVVTILQERTVYRESARMRLSKSLVRIIPDTYEFLTDQGQLDLENLIQQTLATEKHHDISSNLNELLAILHDRYNEIGR